MSKKRVWTFFYGSFINRDVLSNAGVVPEVVEVAHLSGFDIRIEPLANLVPSNHATIYGILARVTHAELERLYALDWVGEYLPEAVLADTADGKAVPALCYFSTRTDRSPADADYVDRIARIAEEYGFPRWYVDRVKSFTPA